MTLKMRKACVIPHGTAFKGQLLSPARQLRVVQPTVSEIFQVDQLIAPLCDDSDRIFDERNHNQETSYGGEVTKTPCVSSWSESLRRNSVMMSLLSTMACGLWLQENVRFQWLSKGVQCVFYLAGLLSNLIQRTGIVGCAAIVGATKLIVQP